MQVIEFLCAEQRFAMPLACVRRAVMSAQPTPLPGAAGAVLGVLNVTGETVTILDIRRRLGWPDAAITPSQQLLIIDLDGFTAGLLVDAIVGVSERSGGALPDKVAAAGFVDSIVRLEDGLCLIVDPELFLLSQEKEALLDALAQVKNGS